MIKQMKYVVDFPERPEHRNLIETIFGSNHFEQVRDIVHKLSAGTIVVWRAGYYERENMPHAGNACYSSFAGCACSWEV